MDGTAAKLITSFVTDEPQVYTGKCVFSCCAHGTSQSTSFVYHLMFDLSAQAGTISYLDFELVHAYHVTLAMVEYVL